MGTWTRRGLLTGAAAAGFAHTGGAAPARATGRARHPRRDELTARLRALPGLRVVEERADAPPGYRHLVLGLCQPVDHARPRRDTFEQRLTLLHTSATRPTILFTTGYEAVLAPPAHRSGHPAPRQPGPGGAPPLRHLPPAGHRPHPPDDPTGVGLGSSGPTPAAPRDAASRAFCALSSPLTVRARLQRGSRCPRDTATDGFQPLARVEEVSSPPSYDGRRGTNARRRALPFPGTATTHVEGPRRKRWGPST
ncbi:hypothetical protein ACSMX9_15005 [Streptomyces sp. LE64]|uniref:hypothetical protein n=1 Tax=Streptomyces sp. LE64 TaxID=3448653 RepID=UPI004041CE69